MYRSPLYAANGGNCPGPFGLKKTFANDSIDVIYSDRYNFSIDASDYGKYGCVDNGLCEFNFTDLNNKKTVNMQRITKTDLLSKAFPPKYNLVNYIS